MVRVQQQIDLAWPCFAQGTRWQHVTVANAHAVHDANFDVPLKRCMLQAIIANNEADVGVLMQELLCRSDAIGAYCDGDLALLKNQQGLITYLIGCTLRVHQLNLMLRASVASGHHTHLMALLGQALHDGHRERGFTAASRYHIAHHNDRGIEFVCLNESQGEQ